jgi:hypothetical protein
MLKWNSLVVGLVLTSLTAPALAGTITLVTSRSELNGNDWIDWASFRGRRLRSSPHPSASSQMVE